MPIVAEKDKPKIINEAQLMHFATGALSWEANHKKVTEIHKSLRQAHPDKISKQFGGASSTGYIGIRNKAHVDVVKAHIEKAGGKIVGARHEEGIKESVLWETDLTEKLHTGGGATGATEVCDPVPKSATLPVGNHNNGMPMTSIAHIAPEEGEEETNTENNTKPTKDTAASNKASVNMKESVAAMFNNEELSEDFKEKATIIFEAAVTANVNAAIEELQEQYADALIAETAVIEENMQEQINQYMTYAVEQWMENNVVAIEHDLKSQITENFLVGLKNLFEEHQINIPDDEFSVVDELQSEIQSMQEKLDSVITENMSLKGEVNESHRDKILADVTEGLAATQVEKLVSLAEGVEYDSAENYRKKLVIVKENYFPTEKLMTGKTQSLMEEIQDDNGQKPASSTNSVVSNYAKAISRTVKK